MGDLFEDTILGLKLIRGFNFCKIETKMWIKFDFFVFTDFVTCSKNNSW
jgi:hypothetical protein